MFDKILEYDAILEEIESKELSRREIDIFIDIIPKLTNKSPSRLLEIIDNIVNGEKEIYDDGRFISIEPLLFENLQTINLLEISLPIISKYIPSDIFKYLTETHALTITEKILDIDIINKFDKQILSNRIDEMFSSGNIAIPIQGLRDKPSTVEIVSYGIFAPLLYKNIKLDNPHYKKNQKLRHIVNNTSEYNSIIMPKFLIRLKKLLEPMR